MLKRFTSGLLGFASVAAITTALHAEEFNIPAGDLKSALTAYAKQTGVPLIVSGEAVRGISTKGAKGEFSF